MLTEKERERGERASDGDNRARSIVAHTHRDAAAAHL
jgi:hypothetical protein